MTRISRRNVLRAGAIGVAAPVAVNLVSPDGNPAFAEEAAAPAAAPAADAVGGSLTGAGPQVQFPVPAGWVVKPFDNNRVTLSPSLFTANRDRVSQFLLNYPIDNMLYLFRLNAGLPTLGASAPGAWEAVGGNLRGHYAGHFLSAHALGYAGTGNTAFLDRVNSFVTALGQCQDALNAQVGSPGGTSPINWTAGRFGNALVLDGASNYATLPSGIVNGLTDFTVSIWVRPSAVTTWSRVFDIGTGTSRYMFLTVSAGSNRPRFAITTGGSGAEQRLSSSQSVSANTWTHLAVTLSGTTGTLYLNGSPVATNTSMTLTPSSLGATANNWIGRSQFGDPLLGGAVDDLQIYSRALSAAEVQGLMSGPGGGDVASYKFDETSGTTAHDSSGNGRNATVFAGTSTPPGPSHLGYLAAYPESQFVALESFATYPTVWAPWYTFHMILRGLIDAYVYCGNQQALQIATGMGDWAWSRLSKLSRATLDGMWRIYIAGEYNAAPAALTDLAVLTGNQDYFGAAQAFVNTYLFDAAANNQDTLNGEHANQHIPQYLGYLYMYERFDTSPPTYRGPAGNYLTATKNFWDMVVPHRIYVDGGMAGSGEIFGARDVIASTIQTANAETCCEYNMMKLGRQLFFHTADPKYMQYYERAMFGQILASRQNVTSNTNPDLTYFIPVNPGAVRSYGNLGTCCGGTGLESHEKFHDSIYFRAVDDSVLYVNLYIPSTLDWSEHGVMVTQSTNYPTDPAGETTVSISGSASFTLKLRVPYWVQKGFTVRVNGVIQSLTAAPGSYVALNRQWQDGDTVSVAAPFTLRTERAIDQPQTQALAYGPVPMVTLNTATSFQTYSFYANLGRSGDLAKVLTPTANPMQFTANGRTVRPFYVADTSAYHVYFHRSEPEVVFGGVDAGVPNAARSDGLTFLDVLWANAPFAAQSDFTRAVSNTANAFLAAGLITRQQSQQLLIAAARVTLGP
jgi:DUF1680 family protein